MRASRFVGGTVQRGCVHGRPFNLLPLFLLVALQLMASLSAQAKQRQEEKRRAAATVATLSPVNSSDVAALRLTPVDDIATPLVAPSSGESSAPLLLEAQAALPAPRSPSLLRRSTAFSALSAALSGGGAGQIAPEAQSASGRVAAREPQTGAPTQALKLTPQRLAPVVAVTQGGVPVGAPVPGAVVRSVGAAAAAFRLPSLRVRGGGTLLLLLLLMLALAALRRPPDFCFCLHPLPPCSSPPPRPVLLQERGAAPQA
jgi:hypothetical protein